MSIENGHVLAMQAHLEEMPVAECEWCDRDLYKHEEAIEYDGTHFCEKDCLVEYVMEQIDYREKYL